MSVRWTIGPIAACALVAVGLAQSAPPQAQTTFRSKVDLVDVDVSVLDEHRRPVRGLTAADFTVLEDGKVRPIAAFTPVDLPPREMPEAPWMDQVAPDVSTNRFPPEGRLVVIMMDRFIATEQRPIAREIAEAAINQLRRGDLAAVVFATHGIPQNFTSDRELLLAAVRRPFATLPDGDRGGASACFCGSCSLETIATVAEGMREVRQRRKILITIGTNISINPQGTCVGTLTGVRERAIRAIQAANVTVHAFDPTGLEAPVPGALATEPPNIQALRAASLRRRGNLAVLPGETGGQVIGGNTPAALVGDVFRESASYYVLGFQPASAVANGRFHEIAVKVGRHDVVLQARRGYYAPGGKAPSLPKAVKDVPPTLATAVAGVWPKTDLALTMQVVPLARPGLEDAELRVVLGVRGETVGDPPSNASATVYVGAFDRNGRSLADTRQTLSIPVPPRADKTVEYEAIGRLVLKPGRYEIRAAIDDATLGASGSVYGYVEVPDFTKEPVTLSGILLQAVEGDGPAPQPPAADSVPIVPTARREFSRTERVTAFIREHQGLTHAMMPGYLNVSLVNSADRRVFGQEMRVLAEQFGSNRATDHVFDLPMAELEPGEYLLVVEVHHGNLQVQRDLRFRVR